MSADLPKPAEWVQKMFAVTSSEKLEAAMMEAFSIQYHHNPIYHKFCNLVGRSPATIHDISGIPYLPVSFFKSDKIVTGRQEVKGYFRSSGTTGAVSSRHYFHDLTVYEASFLEAFRSFYGDPSGYCILALLPSYMEQKNSSLVYMVQKLMEISGHKSNGFFLNDRRSLAERISALEAMQQPTLLIGVTYALLDFGQQFPMPLRHTLVMETGGMKGRKKEMIRAEVHKELKKAFHISAIHSEYGMTELFSQAYSLSEGVFQSPPWMLVSVKEEDDPFGEEKDSGVLYIADLANIYSCCFIATEDQGRKHPEGGFEVLGRLDQSDIRGCSLLFS